MPHDRRTKALLIKRMKSCLRPQTRAFTDREGRYRAWIIPKLDGVAAFGMGQSDDELGRYVIRLHFVEGRPLDKVCSALGISRRTAYRRMDNVFDAAADAVPEQMAKYLLKGDLPEPANLKLASLRLKACPHCGGGQDWDPEGATSMTSGEWRCMACGRRDVLEEHVGTGGTKGA